MLERKIEVEGGKMVEWRGVEVAGEEGQGWSFLQDHPPVLEDQQPAGKDGVFRSLARAGGAVPG